MDEILDRSLREAVGVAELLEQAGVFSRFRQRDRAKQLLTTNLAAEFYMTRIGQASHMTFDEALSEAIAVTNRYLADKSPNMARRNQTRLSAGIAFAALGPSGAASILQSMYELDKTKAAAWGAQ